jgi:hypothetical protein
VSEVGVEGGLQGEVDETWFMEVAMEVMEMAGEGGEGGCSCCCCCCCCRRGWW